MENMKSETEELKPYYVYALINKSSKQVFYIGKGQGKRYQDHLNEAKNSFETQSDKVRMILDLEAQNNYEFLIISRHEKECEALAVESVLIKWVYGIDQLTNEVLGHNCDLVRPKGNYEKELTHLYKEAVKHDGTFSLLKTQNLKASGAYEYLEKLKIKLQDNGFCLQEIEGQYKKFDPNRNNGYLGVIVKMSNMDLMIAMTKNRRPNVYIISSKEISSDTISVFQTLRLSLSEPRNHGLYRRILSNDEEIKPFESDDDLIQFLKLLQNSNEKKIA